MKNIGLLIIISMLAMNACDSKQQNKVNNKIEETVSEKAIGDNVTSNDSRDAVATGSQEKITPPGRAESEPLKQQEKVSLTGEQVYKKSCTGCHATGAANAPKLGDALAWGSRIQKGKEALYSSAVKGIPGTAMMAKGTCMACSDKELKAAVDYMVSKVK